MKLSDTHKIKLKFQVSAITLGLCLIVAIGGYLGFHPAGFPNYLKHEPVWQMLLGAAALTIAWKYLLFQQLATLKKQDQQ